MEQLTSSTWFHPVAAPSWDLQACYDRMMLALSQKLPEIPMLTLWPGATGCGMLGLDHGVPASVGTGPYMSLELW